jgi:hypothetical protein
MSQNDLAFKLGRTGPLEARCHHALHLLTKVLGRQNSVSRIDSNKLPNNSIKLVDTSLKPVVELLLTGESEMFCSFAVRVACCFALLLQPLAPLTASAQQTIPSATDGKPIDAQGEAFGRLLTLLEFASPQRTNLTTGQIKELTDSIKRLRELYAIKSSSAAEKDEIKSLLKKIEPKLSLFANAYKVAADAISEGDVKGLTDKELARIKSLCGGTFDDALRALASGSSGGQELKQRLITTGGKAENCRLLLVDAYAALNTQLADINASRRVLEERRNALEQQIAAASSKEEQAKLRKELAENELEIKKVEEKEEKTRQAKAKIDWLNMLAGLAIFVGGIVAAAYGDEQTGVSMMIAGGKIMESETNKKPKTETYTETKSVPKREGLKADGNPSPENKSAVIKTFVDAGYVNITSPSSMGNFVVLRSADDGSWLVMQIEPRLLVVRITPSSVVAIADGAPKEFKSLNDLREPMAFELSVGDTQVGLKFNAKIDATAVSGGIVEQSPGSRRYNLAFDKAYKSAPSK